MTGTDTDFSSVFFNDERSCPGFGVVVLSRSFFPLAAIARWTTWKEGQSEGQSGEVGQLLPIKPGQLGITTGATN